MRSKTRHFTLLEALIAIILTALLISTVTYFYRQITILDAEFDAQERANFKQRLIENRLAYILPRAVSSKNANFVFFTTNDSPMYLKPHTPSLIFLYNNGNSLDKQRTNEVIARLFVDDESRLVLATWPIPERQIEGEPLEAKREILGEDVDKIAFHFFAPAEVERKSATKQQTEAPKATPLPGWGNSEWSAEFQRLPAIIKIDVYPVPKAGESSEKIKPLTLAFPLPQAEQSIYYEH